MSNEFAMQKSFLHDCSYMYFKGINWKSYFPPPTPYKFKYITTWTDLYSIQKKHSKLIVSTDSSWKDFSIAVFFLLLTLQNIMLQHTIDRQPMLTGSMGQNNKSFLKQFSTSTLTYFKLTMNTLFFQERAQGDAPTDSVCPYIVTISEAAPSVAVPVMQLAPFLFGPLKTLHSNKGMQSINQSIKIIPLPSLKDS